MKKLFLTMCAVAAIITCASCCGNACDKQEAEKPACERPEKGPCCKLSEEERAAIDEMMAKWEKFDELAAEEQAALIAQRKALVEKRIAKCEEHHAAEVARLAEREAKCAEIKAKFEKIDELSIAEQKALLEEIDKPCCKKDAPKCCKAGEKKCCKKGDKPCCKGEKPACDKK